MSKQLVSILTAVPLVAAGVVFSPLSAEAARIGPIATPPGNFNNVYGISSVEGASNGVIVRFNRVTGIPSFDFVPPVDPTGASVGEGNGTYDVDFVNGAFNQFGGTTGTIRDFTGFGGIDAFLTLDSGVFFDLDEVLPPIFTSIGNGTVVSFGVTGNFRQGSRILPGTGTFSATFVGLTQARIEALARRPQGLRTPYSATFEAVPEPMTMLGVGTALGFGALFKRKHAKKQNKG